MDKFQVYPLFMCLLTVWILPAVQGTICNLQMDTSSTSGCDVKGFSAYPVYSCQPCGVSGGQEVHIINMYQPIGGSIPVNILANHSVSMKLVLSSHQIVHWKINKPDFVEVSKVILMGVHNDYSSVSLTDRGHLNVTSTWRSFRLMYDAGIIEYATTHLGKVTSYSAVYQTCRWWLSVGNCDSSQADCTGKLPCWAKYNFRFPSFIDKCTGDQYVTWYKIEDTTYYIGAILCTNSRYSLFMSTSLQDEFLDIADSNGNGEDHCELVGMDKEDLPKVKVELEDTFLYGDMSYNRNNWGGAFRKAYHVKRRPEWYECGITIPDAKRLYTESESRSFNIPLCVAIVMVLVFLVFVAVIWGRHCWKKHRMPDEDCQVTTSTVPNTNTHVYRQSTIHWVPPSEPVPPWLQLRRRLEASMAPPAPPASSAPSAPPQVPLRLRLPASTAPQAPSAPSAPSASSASSAPSALSAPSAPSAQLSAVGGPPGYEDALTYPLAPGAEVETPPPAYTSL